MNSMQLLDPLMHPVVHPNIRYPGKSCCTQQPPHLVVGGEVQRRLTTVVPRARIGAALEQQLANLHVAPRRAQVQRRITHLPPRAI